MSAIKTPKQIAGKFYNIERDGITQSLLSIFMSCRRAALWYLQGWVLKSPSFPLTFGSITHGILERVYTDIRLGKLRSSPSREQTLKYIDRVEKIWKEENPRADAKATELKELSLLVAEATMPLYFDYWSKDLKGIVWEKIEGNFKTPFALPDGRKTFLRGAMDGVYRNPKRWLLETKTKSRIDERDLVDFLPFELQVNFYLMNLIMQGGDLPRGVLYNIIRRTQLKQGKKETIPQYGKRIAEDIKSRPEDYFIRMEISIGRDEMEEFRKEVTGLLTDFYDWWEGKIPHYRNSGHCQTKYGRCEYLAAETGRMSIYTKRERVFRELEDN